MGLVHAITGEGGNVKAQSASMASLLHLGPVEQCTTITILTTRGDFYYLFERSFRYNIARMLTDFFSLVNRWGLEHIDSSNI